MRHAIRSGTAPRAWRGWHYSEVLLKKSGATTKKGAIASALRNILALAIFLAYLFLLADLLLFANRPPADSTPAAIEGYLSWRVNLTPLKTIKHYMRSSGYSGFVNNVGNVLAFMPFGFFMGYFSRGRAPALFCVALSALASLFFESLQLFLLVGSFDVDDIILNTLGGAVGYAGLFLLRRFAGRHERRATQRAPARRRAMS
ncbi:MAG: VanZ family protein [Clostridiales bacterium]|nr:VanZ family protein [Clostridiales bacterium]